MSNFTGSKFLSNSHSCKDTAEVQRWTLAFASWSNFLFKVLILNRTHMFISIYLQSNQVIDFVEKEMVTHFTFMLNLPEPCHMCLLSSCLSIQSSIFFHVITLCNLKIILHIHSITLFFPLNHFYSIILYFHSITQYFQSIVWFSLNCWLFRFSIQLCISYIHLIMLHLPFNHLKFL